MFFHALVALLVWAALGLFNVWIWNKEKAQSSLLMMVGAFAQAFTAIVMLFKWWSAGELAVWVGTLGLLVFGFGFYVLVKNKVLGNLQGLKKKAAELAKPEAGEPKA